MDAGRYDSMEGIGRVESGTETERNAGAVTEDKKTTKNNIFFGFSLWEPAIGWVVGRFF